MAAKNRKIQNRGKFERDKNKKRSDTKDEFDEELAAVLRIECEGNLPFEKKSFRNG